MFYELVMAMLALSMVFILVYEYTGSPSEEVSTILYQIDLLILSVFAFDYFYRFYRADDKWHFFKNNIFDLIAIIPFDKAFRVARLTRLFRLARLVRVILIARRIKEPLIGVFKTNGLIYVIITTIFLIVIGAVAIIFVDPAFDDFGDALWWSLVTATTVGYGDIAPESTGGRIIAGFLMIAGIGFLGMLTGSIATYFVDKLAKEREDKSVIDDQLEFVKNKLDEIDTLSSDDINYLKKVIDDVWSIKNNNSEQ